MSNEIPNPSIEQQSIIDSLKNNNVVVNSVVGSGKTTTVLQIAKAFPDKEILLLTYNKRLKLDTRVRAINLRNIEIHSFHSFCVSYYDNKEPCHNDYGILELLGNSYTQEIGEPHKSKIYKPVKDFAYDLIIVDEAQDINPIYYEVVCKIVNENNTKHKCRYCVIGDVNQSIYGYNEADERYIQNASKLFGFNNSVTGVSVNHVPWVSKKLTETFRLTENITNFTNNALLKENRIISHKPGPKQPIRYVICNQYSDYRTRQEIQYYLDKGYTYNDFFILAPSVRSQRTPIRKLANKLSSEGVPIYCPISDNEKLDSEITEGKIIFCTFHQVKGLERKVVLVYNFDDSYFKFYKRDRLTNKCPNELYVAVTRSMEALTLFHHYTHDYLPFLDMRELRKTCVIDHSKELKLDGPDNDKSKTQTVSVTELLRHLTVKTIEEALTFIDIEQIHEKDSFIDIPNKTAQKFGDGTIYESVSEITGLAIPSYYELCKTGKMTIKEMLDQDSMRQLSVMYDLQSKFYKNDELLRNTYDGYPFRETLRAKESIDSNGTFVDDTNSIIDPEELLYLTNKWSALSSGFTFKMKQITTYRWLTQDMLDRCVSRLSEHISENAQYENFYSVDYETADIDSKILRGYVDCVDFIEESGGSTRDKITNIWEFKCVTEIDRVYFLQVALYIYLYLENNTDSVNSDNSKVNFFLFNILDHEIYQIKITNENLKKLVDFLFVAKFGSEKHISDEEFIKINMKIKDKYFKPVSGNRSIRDYFGFR